MKLTMDSVTCFDAAFQPGYTNALITTQCAADQLHVVLYCDTPAGCNFNWKVDGGCTAATVAPSTRCSDTRLGLVRIRRKRTLRCSRREPSERDRQVLAETHLEHDRARASRESVTIAAAPEHKRGQRCRQRTVGSRFRRVVIAICATAGRLHHHARQLAEALGQHHHGHQPEEEEDVCDRQTRHDWSCLEPR
jgi:hypothetical protein